MLENIKSDITDKIIHWKLENAFVCTLRTENISVTLAILCAASAKNYFVRTLYSALCLFSYLTSLNLLHSGRPKLYTILDFLSAKGLRPNTHFGAYSNSADPVQMPQNMASDQGLHGWLA